MSAVVRVAKAVFVVPSCVSQVLIIDSVFCIRTTFRSKPRSSCACFSQVLIMIEFVFRTAFRSKSRSADCASKPRLTIAMSKPSYKNLEQLTIASLPFAHLGGTRPRHPVNPMSSSHQPSFVTFGMHCNNCVWSICYITDRAIFPQHGSPICI